MATRKSTRAVSAQVKKAVKEAISETAVVKEEVKEAVKEAAEEVKAVAKKAPVKKPAARKAAEPSAAVHFQYNGRDIASFTAFFTCADTALVLFLVAILSYLPVVCIRPLGHTTGLSPAQTFLCKCSDAIRKL